MRLVVLALSIPVMFIAAGLSILLYPRCGLAMSLVVGYLVLLPSVYYARPLLLQIRYFPISLALLMAVAALSLVVSPHLGDYDTLIKSFITAMAACPEWRMYFFLGAVVLAPIVEETLFRAILYRELEKRAGALVGYIGNSIIFAVIHGLPALIPIYFLYGLVLTYAYSKSGVVASIALHSLNNFLAFLYYDYFGGFSQEA